MSMKMKERRMKPEEAIEVLSNELIVITDMIGYCKDFEKESDLALAYRVKRQEAHNAAISAIKEVQQYRAIGTVEECREAVEKRKPKKPKEILRHRGGFEMQHCPKCDTDYQVDRRYKIKDGYCPACEKLLDSAFRNYCANCGQAIDENLEGMEDE